MGPIEEPFSYSKQQRPAGAASAPYPLPRQSFTLAGGHRSSQWPSYPSTPATCPGNDHRPGPALVFSIAFHVFVSLRYLEEKKRKREKRRERENRLETHAHTRTLVQTIFRPRSLLCASLEIAIDRFRKSSRSPRLPLSPSFLARMLIVKQLRLLANKLRLLREDQVLYIYTHILLQICSR